MKKLILITLAVIISLPILAQNTANLFEQLTDKYADQDGFSATMITSDMFDLYLKKRNIEEESPVFEALKNLDKILVVSQSNFTGKIAGISTDDAKKENTTNLLHKTILDHYKNGGFTLLKTEKRMGEDVKVYLLKIHDKIQTMALITASSMTTNLVELKGDIDLKTVSELGKALNLRGLENLYKIDNSSSAMYGVASAGIGANSRERIEEMVARQQEMVERQSALTDEQRVKIEEQAEQMAQKQLQMAEKYREMAEKYQREPIFLNYPGDTNTVYYLDGKKVKAKEIKELDSEKIESVEVNKAEKEGGKTTVRVKTK
ncbi:MAG: DUF4252 domain-containing protein [Prolixibacteraceae bacterium]|jgi:hypothetical protein|nr:DUF4252 domain-containing protein [Prolixibacteraceae bacterium]MBT6006551.1 DUF4252 domain-containing protein [Prolixibacteraceae bacterium]MBT6766752.1 DUF4252 domain-containing protein [Prolixibacteraceae bacterium]MBT6998864.1 DUF4252 domain-containing protein [Prolixibacteraceae bacterium]MBT7394191.1 DUF4252 domain-containing protein [Prolixibacteraceae bacterium]